ncbi:MAG: helix-turn-helix transcriptional regulator [Clostridiales bacterium]|nr:helix-turn-helix transcriptional regulator [Clostridiales bacterium]
MKKIEYRAVNWKDTGRNLQNLRLNNYNLRKYVCWQLNGDKNNCEGDCENCRLDMDNHISQSELARVFYLDNESRIVNWEKGRARPTVSDLLFYAEICRIPLEEVLVFESSAINKKQQ